MYNHVDDKKFIKKLRTNCSGVVNELVMLINSEDYLKVEMQMVGSGAKNLITQNADKPIDLDYNLNIVDIDGDINDGSEIKEYIRKCFNIILSKYNQNDCKDSTSVLTSGLMNFETGKQTKFSIDIAIVCQSKGKWYRLIHDKTGYVSRDRWFWNEAPHSNGLEKKIDRIKKAGKWLEVRDVYLNKKNFYLQNNDNSHPSFICYIEAINEVFQQLRD